MSDLVYRFDTQIRQAAPPPPPTPADAIRRLEAGNLDFSRQLADAEAPLTTGRLDMPTLGAAPAPTGAAPLQLPFAAVLGCSDARVPTEMVFGQAYNDMFVVRVAGNVLGAEALGSLDYAVANLGGSLRVIVVLGHSGCGAVTAAADAFIDPGRYLRFSSSHPLRAIVDRIFPAVRAAHASLVTVYGQQVETAPGYRTALTETAVALNAAVTAAAVRDELRGQLGDNRQVVYGVYNLVSRRVKLTLETDDNVAIRLAPAPEGPDGFEKLGLLVAGSGWVRELLGV